jgi:hypothetical protein
MGERHQDVAVGRFKAQSSNSSVLEIVSTHPSSAIVFATTGGATLARAARAGRFWTGGPSG